MILAGEYSRIFLFLVTILMGTSEDIRFQRRSRARQIVPLRLLNRSNKLKWHANVSSRRNLFVFYLNAM